METKMSLSSLEYNPTKSISGMTKFFFMCGLWPAAKRFRWLYIAYASLFHLIFNIAYLFCKFMNFFLETNKEMLTVGFFLFLAETSLFVRIINLLVHFDQAVNCLTIIDDFRIYDRSESILMDKHLTLFSTIMKWYMGAGTSACIFSWVAPLFSSDRMLPYPGWYPLDWRNDEQSYWFVFMYQVVGVTFQTSTIILLQLLSIYFMTVIGAQLDILKYRLENLGQISTADNEIVQRRAEAQLINCVVVHNDVLRLTKMVESVFTTQFLFQFITTSVIFCVTAYRIALMNISNEIITFIFYISFCMVILFDIFLACYFGNEIILKNLMLSFAVYSSNWINLSPKFKKNMFMFLEVLKKPKMIKTGKIFTLTLDSFLIVINRSYSLFAVLQNTLK